MVVSCFPYPGGSLDSHVGASTCGSSPLSRDPTALFHNTDVQSGIAHVPESFAGARIAGQTAARVRIASILHRSILKNTPMFRIAGQHHRIFSWELLWHFSCDFRIASDLGARDSNRTSRRHRAIQATKVTGFSGLLGRILTWQVSRKDVNMTGF